MFAQMFSVSDDGVVTEFDTAAHLSSAKLIERYGAFRNLMWAGSGAHVQRELIRELCARAGNCLRRRSNRKTRRLLKLKRDTAGRWLRRKQISRSTSQLWPYTLCKQRKYNRRTRSAHLRPTVGRGTERTMSITERGHHQRRARAFPSPPMTEHDLLEVVEIEESSGLSRWGWAAYYAELQGSNSDLMLVARIVTTNPNDSRQQLAGYIVARMGADELHINNVAVRETYRRRGSGAHCWIGFWRKGQRSGSSVRFSRAAGRKRRPRLHFMKSVGFG